ncbi:hypothetical protein [Bradyrhizobium sp. CCBAU 53338]|uniref:hypothetical protein n=1 Tax=Bradyrhizobium sp. CCBAU 53338 TaxID=1325111 RepID=UPI00188B4545|nr:hypothetical protein [Bradyrhizobium sp. CCBAU 53338]
MQLQPDQLEALDAWIEKQASQLSRAQAICCIVKSRLKGKTNPNRSKLYSKTQLRDALETLRAPTPISDRLKKEKDDDYRKRLIRWTVKNSKSRNAREVYNRLQVPEWILWINEAAGVSAELIRKAKSEMRRSVTRQQQAANVRSVLQWGRAAQLLFDKHSAAQRR